MTHGIPDDTEHGVVNMENTLLTFSYLDAYMDKDEELMQAVREQMDDEALLLNMTEIAVILSNIMATPENVSPAFAKELQEMNPGYVIVQALREAALQRQ